MANEEHLAIIQEGTEVWNKWRKANKDIRPDLSGADLSWGFLPQANLSKASLRGVDLSNSFLFTADLSQADLSGANFRWANLTCVDLYWADLRKADLYRAELHRTNLHSVDLSGANLNEADFDETSISNVDLSEVKGLEDATHTSRSFIDIHTIYKSRGDIPGAFLRGIGVPDVFIEYMGSLVGKAIEYYSCFINYSHQDQPLAERLHADLQNNGVRCWYAPHDLRIGEDYKPRIDEAIRLHDKLLLILSESSVASEWVEREVEAALDKERTSEQRGLFPIRIDEAVMELKAGWAAHIRDNRHIGDFCQWENYPSYQEVFQRLLRDLKTDQKAPMPAAVFTKPRHTIHGIELDQDRVNLLKLMVRLFNKGELKTFVFELNVDYDDLPGETKTDKARELISYFECQRPGGAATLAEYVRDKRPYAFD